MASLDRNGGGWPRSEHGEKRELRETERTEQGREKEGPEAREGNKTSMETCKGERSMAERWRHGERFAPERERVRIVIMGKGLT